MRKIRAGRAPEADPNQSKFIVKKGLNNPTDVEEEDGEEIT